MPEKELKPVEQRVKSFAVRLKRDFSVEIKQDPSKFKARVLGTLKAVLAEKTAGRKGSSRSNELRIVISISTLLRAFLGTGMN